MATSNGLDPSVAAQHKEPSRMSRRNRWIGYLFIAPWLVGFLVFGLYPFLASLFYSFTSYDIFTPARWFGLHNYTHLFAHDPLFWTSLWNTLYYTIFMVPIGAVIGIIIALILNMKVKGMAGYRTIYYLPTILPMVASSILWIWLFNPSFGIINSLLRLVHIHGPGWLFDPNWVKPSMIIMSLWGVGGTVIIYLAGLQDVPQELYESADLDGAKWYHKIRYVTLPMISPVIFFNVIMGLIGSFQYFTQAFVMTQGGPDNSSLFYALYLYQQAFQYFHMGYASAMAWVLFVIILLATLLVFRTSAKWVYYGGER